MWSMPLTLVELYADWCGPCRTFKTVMGPLMSEQHIIFVQVKHNNPLIQNLTTKNTFNLNRKNSCQPTFLLLNQKGALLHLQRGLVVSELKRVIRENINSIGQQLEWHKNNGSNSGKKGQGQGGENKSNKEEAGWSSATAREDGAPKNRRQSMKVDQSELRRRNSMASANMKNAFKNSKKKHRNSVLIMQSKGEDKDKDKDKGTMQNVFKGLNNMQNMTT